MGVGVGLVGVTEGGFLADSFEMISTRLSWMIHFRSALPVTMSRISRRLNPAGILGVVTFTRAPELGGEEGAEGSATMRTPELPKPWSAARAARVSVSATCEMGAPVN